MLRRIVFAGALVALGLSVPATVARAQDMGGSSDEGKKDDDAKKDDGAKPDAPKPADSPKPDAAKPADAPKPDAGKPADAPKADAKKALVLDAPSSWTAGRVGKRGATKARFKVKAAEGDSEDAHAELLDLAGKGGDFDAELARWCKQWKGSDGKKLDKSAAKVDALDTAGGVKGKTAELSGTFLSFGGKRKKGGDDSGEKPKPEEKSGYKALIAYLEGPDGVWVARLTGPEKTVEKNRDDFMKWVKSAKVGDAPASDEAPKKHKKDDDD